MGARQALGFYEQAVPNFDPLGKNSRFQKLVAGGK